MIANVNMADYLIPKEIYDELFSDYLELVQKEEQLQQENARFKDKIKDLEEWLEAMASMYALLLAIDSCLMELYEENQALLSNQESILETNGVLLRRLLKLSGITDVEGVINGKSNS